MESNSDRLYQILGLQRDATQDEIKKQYRHMSKVHHPDKGGDLEFMKKLNLAYKTLSNIELREEYDANMEDDDDTILTNAHGFLNVGTSLSQDFRKNFENWVKEYPNVRFVDNIKDALYDIVNQVVDGLPTIDLSCRSTKKYFCDICENEFLNEEQHKGLFLDSYKELFIGNKVNFDNAFRSLFQDDVWNWKKVSFVSLKSSTEWIENGWNRIRGWQQSLKNSLEVIEPGYKNIWLEFVKDDELADKLGRNLAMADHLAIFNPNTFRERQTALRELFRDIKFEFESILPESIVKSVNGGEKRVKSQENLSLAMPSLKKYFDKKYIRITILDPPDWKPDNTSNNCFLCLGGFGFFTRKHHCRSCGNIFCANCLILVQVPKFGYIDQVKCCIECSKKDRLFDSFNWIEIADKAVFDGDLISAENALILAQNFYSTIPEYKKIMHEKEDLFWKNKQYGLFLCCLYLIHPSKDDWDIFIYYMDYCCQNNMYPLLLAIIKRLSSQEKFGIKFWQEVGEKKQSQDSNSILPFIFYIEAGYPLEKILIVTDIGKKGLQMNHKIYLSYASVKCSKTEWKTIGDKMLESGNYKMAMYAYNICFTKKEWLKLIDEFLEKKRMSEALQLLDFLKAKKILTVNEHALYAIIEEKSLDRLIGKCITCVRQGLTTYAEVIMGFILKRYSLSDHLESFIRKRAYEELAVCLKVTEKHEGAKERWFSFSERLIKDDSSASFQLLELCGLSWKELGDKYFNMERFSTSLQCYLMQQNCNFDYLIAQGNKLSERGSKEHASLFYLQAYKNESTKISAFYCLCKLGWSPNIKNALQGFIQQYKVEDVKMKPFHYLLSHINFASKQFKYSWGALHFSAKDPKNSEYANHCNSLRKIIMTDHSSSFQKLRAAAYEGRADQLCNLLQHLDYWEISSAQEFLNEQIINKNLMYRSILSFIKAGICINERKWEEALNEINNSLLYCPTQERARAAAKLLQNEELMIFSYKSFISAIKNLAMADVDTFTKLIFSEDALNTEIFKISKNIGFIKKFEKAIRTRFKEDDVETGYSYLDLIMAVGDSSASANCLIIAATYFLKVQSSIYEKAEIYAYRNLITTLAIQAFTVASSRLNPVMQIYIYKQAFGLIIKSNQNLAKHTNSSKNKSAKSLIEPSHSFVLKRLLKMMVNLARIVPISSIPMLSSFEILFFNISSSNMVQEHLNLLESRKIESSLCPKYMAQYYQLEGSWRGWIDEDFEEKRQNSMQSLLKQNGWTLKNVENIFSSKIIPRNPQGWLYEEPVALNLDKKTFTKVNGVKFNLKTGVYEFLLERDEMDVPLFDLNDVNEIMKKGIRSTFFTLDQPNGSMEYFPFQDMKYFPSNLENSRFLETLLHADYLLKMISMGTEVSTKSPFPIKEALQGFMKRLPIEFLELLTPISQRKTSISDNAHRFWIEADVLPYRYVKTDHEIIYYFGEVKMKVKKHLLTRDENGDLRDADQDDDDSIESEFAKIFTDYYESIGLYFPELLRLRELYKLAHICEITAGLYQGLKQLIGSITADIPEVRSRLDPIKSQIKFPLASDQNLIEQILDDTLRNNSVSRYQLNYSQLSELREGIKNKLRTTDSSHLTQVTTAISEGFDISTSSIRGEISDWLSYRSTGLYQTLAEHVRNKKIAQLRPLCTSLENAKFNTSLKEEEQFKWNNSQECSWVPAAFSKLNNHASKYRVYGGVNLCLRRAEQDIGTRHGPMNKGPLHSIRQEGSTGTVADTFRSGSYTTRTTNEPTRLYRVQNYSPNQQFGLSNYWTSQRPLGPVQSIVDSALDRKWGNTAKVWIEIEVPKGRIIHEGAAAKQGGLVGGGNQIYIQGTIPHSWVKNSGKFGQ